MNKIIVSRFFAAGMLAISSAALFGAPAHAGSTLLLTDKNAAIAFPFSPPNRATSGPGAIDNMVIGATTPQPGTFSSITNKGFGFGFQGAPFAATTSATLTAANIQTKIITVLQGGGANSAQQLPLGTAMDTAFPGAVANSTFEFSVINLSVAASETATITTNTGWTLVGSMIVAIQTATTGATPSAGRFLARKTGTGTWTLYRVS